MSDNSIPADFTQNFDYVPWQKTFHTFVYLRFFAKAYSLHFVQNQLEWNYQTRPNVYPRKILHFVFLLQPVCILFPKHVNNPICTSKDRMGVNMKYANGANNQTQLRGHSGMSIQEFEIKSTNLSTRYTTIAYALVAIFLLSIGLFLLFGPIRKVGVTTAEISNLQEIVIAEAEWNNVAVYTNMYEYVPITIQSAYYYVEDDAPKFIMQALDDVIVIFYGDVGLDIHLATNIPVSALPYEEQLRLINGIAVHSEDELIRLLEDYGS